MSHVIPRICIYIDVHRVLEYSIRLFYVVRRHSVGLNARDRDIVQELFLHGKVQIVISTSTLAWGVNFPAHLVVVKGTEYFDPKKGR
jgi:activating signal cointegrator complex subunit 3